MTPTAQFLEQRKEELSSELFEIEVEVGVEISCNSTPGGLWTGLQS